MFWRREKLLKPTCNQIPGYEAHCLDTTPTTLYSLARLPHLLGFSLVFLFILKCCIYHLLLPCVRYVLFMLCGFGVLLYGRVFEVVWVILSFAFINCFSHACDMCCLCFLGFVFFLIVVYLQEVGLGYENWIGLAQDRDRWRALVSEVRNLRVP